MELPLFFSPALDPQAVLEVLKQVVGAVPEAQGPGVGFRGVVSKDGRWVAEYSVRYRVAQSAHKDSTREVVWLGVRGAFLERGWDLSPVPAPA